MPSLNTMRQIKIAARTARNLVRGRPITVSFEVTFNCNANCEHCNWGAPVNEPTVEAPVWGDLVARLKPAVVQISGGEPLLRKDIFDLIAEMRRRDPLPVFVLTSNVSLMDEEKYTRLREAGVDEFSLSLDFPDERHNEFRKLDRCFEHMSTLVPKLAAHGHKDILLATVVQRENYRELPRMAELAKEWGVGINFSVYTHLRSGREDLLINGDGDLDSLRGIVSQLVEMQKSGYPIVTSEYSLHKMLEFYRDGRQPNCQAGRRFFIVNPWAKLAPCGMIQAHFASQKEMLTEFSRSNACDLCYTAIRGNSEKSVSRMLADALRVVRKRSA